MKYILYMPLVISVLALTVNLVKELRDSYGSHDFHKELWCITLAVVTVLAAGFLGWGLIAWK